MTVGKDIDRLAKQPSLYYQRLPLLTGLIFRCHMDIRRYQEHDAAEVKALHQLAMQQAGAYIPGPWNADMEAITGTYLNGRGEFLVGLIDSKIIAMGALRSMTKTIGEIKRLRVHPDYQQQGLGQQILASLEIAARSLGYNQLELDTLEGQVAAIRFFERHGYRRQGTRQFGNHKQLLMGKKIGPVDGAAKGTGKQRPER